VITWQGITPPAEKYCILGFYDIIPIRICTLHQHT
jgi:hypothetical protein